jgi:hypothetical protein
LALKKPVPPSVIAYHDHLAHIEAGNALDPASFEELAPAADRGVVEERGMGGLPALPLVQKHQGRAAGYAASRKPSRERRKRLAIFFAAEARPNPAESAHSETARNFSRLFNQSGYSCCV